MDTQDPSTTQPWDTMQPFVGDRIISADLVDGWPVLTFEDGQRVRLTCHDIIDIEVFEMKAWRAMYGDIIG